MYSLLLVVSHSDFELTCMGVTPGHRLLPYIASLVLNRSRLPLVLVFPNGRSAVNHHWRYVPRYLVPVATRALRSRPCPHYCFVHAFVEPLSDRMCPQCSTCINRTSMSLRVGQCVVCPATCSQDVHGLVCDERSRSCIPHAFYNI